VTQLRCGGMFGNHSTTNFSQNVPAKKKFENRSGNDMDKTLWHTFLSHPVEVFHYISDPRL